MSALGFGTTSPFIKSIHYFDNLWCQSWAQPDPCPNVTLVAVGRATETRLPRRSSVGLSQVRDRL